MINNHQMIIEDYDCITHFDDGKLTYLQGTTQVTIIADDLKIKVLDDCQCIVEGLVNIVEYQYEKNAG